MTGLFPAKPKNRPACHEPVPGPSLEGAIWPLVSPVGPGSALSCGRGWRALSSGRNRDSEAQPKTLNMAKPEESNQSDARCWKRAPGILCLAALLASSPASVFGLGLRVPNQDAFAIGRGNAFVATADNPSAIYYNPAGITQLDGQNVQVGSLFYLGIYADYDSPSGQSLHNDAEITAAPTLQYTFTPQNSPLSFGVGVYEPFGFSVKWPNDVPFRQDSLNGNLTYITINPVVAWKVLPTLSIGAGPTFNYSRITLVQGLLPTPIPLFSADQTEFKGDGWSYGFNGGVLWQPLPQWSFGASYRSRSRMDYNGDFSLNLLPAHVQLGRGVSMSSSSPNCHRRRFLPPHPQMEPRIRCRLGRLDIGGKSVLRGRKSPSPPGHWIGRRASCMRSASRATLTTATTSARATFTAKPLPQACTSHPWCPIRTCTSAASAADTKARVGVGPLPSRSSAAAIEP